MTVLTEKHLRYVSHCHFPPIVVPLPPVPIDPVLFPAAKEGFDKCSVASAISLIGSSTHRLYDISGFTRSELREELQRSRKSRDWHTRVSIVRFLQCLEWLQNDDYVQKFPFNRIVAYLNDGDPIVTDPIENGFKCADYQGDDVPWPEGTLCLFWVDEL